MCIGEITQVQLHASRWRSIKSVPGDIEALKRLLTTLYTQLNYRLLRLSSPGAFWKIFAMKAIAVTDQAGCVSW